MLEGNLITTTRISATLPLTANLANRRRLSAVKHLRSDKSELFTKPLHRARAPIIDVTF